MKTFSNCILALVLCLGLAAGASAQDEMMPAPTTDKMKELDFLVGTWHGDMQWRATDTSTEWAPGTADATYTKGLDGHVLKGEWKLSAMGMEFSGISLDAYDHEKSEFQSLWIDTMLPRMRIYTGNREGDTITMVGEETMMGETYPSKIHIKVISDTEFHWDMQYSNDGGKTWWTSGKSVYKKQG